VTQPGRWEWLEARQRFGVRPGLERVRALLEALGHPEANQRIVLVAGTNGKGSTTALLHAMLRAAGVRAGRFVSPHLERFEERVVVDGGDADAERLARAAVRARPAIDATGATYFEALTALALLAFADAGVDTAVLEVGMGGRWDATNATDPTLSLLVSVALDHTEVLGDTVERIARDKAGVARTARPFLCGASGSGLAAARAEAERVGALVWALDDVPWRAVDHGWEGVEVELVTPGGASWRLGTPLLGRHQARNLALAAAAAERLGLSEEAARLGAGLVSWPGRLERLDVRGRRWLLDGAHNPAGAEALASSLATLAPEGAAALVIGVSADKDAEGMARALVGHARRVIVTRAGSSARARDPEQLADVWRRAGADVVVVGDPERALAAAEGASAPNEGASAPGEGASAPNEGASVPGKGASAPGELVVVAGSLFLVGEVRTLLHGGIPAAAPRWQ
jgi:dihydrofolate synthase / folylpolyglutamate synthase